MSSQVRRRAAGRADRVAGLSLATSRATRGTGECLRQMSQKASSPDTCLRRHVEESANRHRKWDDPSGFVWHRDPASSPER